MIEFQLNRAVTKNTSIIISFKTYFLRPSFRRKIINIGKYLIAYNRYKLHWMRKGVAEIILHNKINTSLDKLSNSPCDISDLVTFKVFD